jgi:hypothetical protein
VPNSLSAQATITDDFQLISKEPVTSRLRYNARSMLRYHANVMELNQQLSRAVHLPKGFNPRARELAQSWRNQSPAQIVNTALRHFNQENFSYTLEPPLLGVNSVDEFLFDTRQGFCEHYASAFVFLMRAAGVPARVVTGYLGGEFNNVGNYYIIRQSDAHAWAEVWLAGQGWVRVDPTAAIAPERVQKSVAQSVKNNAAMPFMARNPPQWLSKLRFNWDAAANQWNQWVLGYDTERQFDFLTRLGMEEVTWQTMASRLGAGIALFIGIFTLWMMRHVFGKKTDPIQAHWLALCATFAQIGLPRADHESASDYAKRIAQARPDLAAAIRAIAIQYNRLRYGDKRDETTQREWLRQVRGLKRKVK